MSRLVAALLIALVGTALTRAELSAEEIFPGAGVELACLDPSAFPDLPGGIQDWMARRGYCVPQSYCRSDTHNVFVAAIGGSLAMDWVVLCSTADTSRIVVFWDGRVDSTTELAAAPNSTYWQTVGESRFGWSRLVTPREPAKILFRYREYDAEPPVLIDHPAIEDIYCEKASTVYYWREGRMYVLLGAD